MRSSTKRHLKQLNVRSRDSDAEKLLGQDRFEEEVTRLCGPIGPPKTQGDEYYGIDVDPPRWRGRTRANLSALDEGQESLLPIPMEAFSHLSDEELRHFHVEYKRLTLGDFSTAVAKTKENISNEMGRRLLPGDLGEVVWVSDGEFYGEIKGFCPLGYGYYIKPNPTIPATHPARPTEFFLKELVTLRISEA